jgi:L-rhamnose isomerase
VPVGEAWLADMQGYEEDALAKRTS